MSDTLAFNIGSQKNNVAVRFAVITTLVVLTSIIIGLQGIKTGTLILVGPFIIASGLIFFLSPKKALIAALVLSFFISGLSRYITFQWGLGIDFLLFIALLGIFFKEFKSIKFGHYNKDFVIWGLVWMGFVVIEILNPEARSIQAWFYAMRGVGFYQILTFLLVVWVVKSYKDMKQLLQIMIALSLLGAFWAMKQKFIGIDSAEYDWLWVAGHHDEHVLFGVLRAFSFYSDAGQFGASQAMFALVCFTLTLGPWKIKHKIFFGICFVITFVGFGISGSRGALAIPAIGGIAFLILSKNFKLLIFGVLVMSSTYYLLKYTHVGHGVEQVRRMRTALDADNPSLKARLKNQVTFGNYLKSRPLGGGIGSAGYWGERYSPYTIIAQTPTDSYYVKIWAETGIVGLCLHVLMLGYFIGKGAIITWHLKEPKIRFTVLAMFCAVVGVLFASYGNQVYSQMPTGIIMSIFIPLIFLSPEIEQRYFSKNKI